jgi:signal transduction histidine kinase
VAPASKGGQYGRVSLAWRDRPSIAIGWTVLAAIVVGIASLVVSTTLSATIYGMPVAAAFPLALLQALAVPSALARPALAASASAVVVIAFALLQTHGGHAPWPWAVATIITHATVIGLAGLLTRTRIALAAWAFAIAGTIVVAFLYPRGTDEAAINIIIAGAISGVALGAGTVLREWRSIRGQLVRERASSAEEHARRVLAEEKTRLARELHDVVAHSMSIINVQASSAVYRHSDITPAVAQELDEIAAAARGAMSELRGLLSVLREEGMAQQLAPQPGFADIPELVQAAARSGVAISYRHSGDTDRVIPDAVGLAAYRIAQEAMSNAIRHAPGSEITVACHCGESWLTVAVANTAPSIRATVSEIGHGLVGMRERAAAAGGSIDIGPTPSGGYAVTARLPTDPQDEQA